MAAGAIDHETGTRDIIQLGGLRRVMPVTFVAVTLAALSMAGVLPLFVGYLGKKLIYEAALNRAGGGLAADRDGAVGQRLHRRCGRSGGRSPLLGTTGTRCQSQP